MEVNREREVQLNKYFENRGVDTNYYLNFKIPAWLRERLPTDKNAPILDIGCGFGQLLLALKREGYTNLTGVDISHEAVGFCVSQGLNVILINSLEEYCASKPAPYALVTMSHVLEHIEKTNVINTLLLIKSFLLAQSGYFIVMIPNGQSNTGAYWMYEDFTHYTLFTAGSMIYVLKSAGFTEIEFLDPDATAGLGYFAKLKKRFFLRLYTINLNFWNRVTGSSFHLPSPRIFTWELKVKAK